MLAKHLGIGVVQASRRAKRALKKDWLVNSEQRKFYPADYAPGESMPPIEGLPVLSPVNALENGSDNPDSSTNQETVNRFTPLTDGNMSTPCSKMDGYCQLWTDSESSGQCRNTPETCPYRIATTPTLTPIEST